MQEAPRDGEKSANRDAWRQTPRRHRDARVADPAVQGILEDVRERFGTNTQDPDVIHCRF